ncbi:MAG: hypothetical protein ACR2N6_09375 [Miltoncostaeaceae bacterium]
MPRDWSSEIEAWTERFRSVDRPPEAFAEALAGEGWSDAARDALAEDAASYASSTQALLAQIAASGIDLVRFDCKQGSCDVCEKYCGKAYSLRGDTPELPPPPPLPICPACRHTLNLLTPFYLQSLGLEIEDLAAEAQPFVD